jgi:SAM-dependent methyltransferase
MTTPRLYDELAWLWPLLSPPEDYAPEAEVLRALMAAHFGDRRGGRRLSLLELGAGGGHTLCHLADDFDCLAVDLSEPMLANCRRLVPNAETHVGDMRTLRLGRTFDIVLVHDAIDYMTSAEDARAACGTIAAHLSPGGVAFIAPTYTRETFTDGEVADDGTTTDAEELTYFTYVHDPDPTDDQFEMILLYLIRDQATRRVTVIEDRHACGLFSVSEWRGFCHEVGMSARHEAEDGGWSLFVATFADSGHGLAET